MLSDVVVEGAKRQIDYDHAWCWWFATFFFFLPAGDACQAGERNGCLPLLSSSGVLVVREHIDRPGTLVERVLGRASGFVVFGFPKMLGGTTFLAPSGPAQKPEPTSAAVELWMCTVTVTVRVRVTRRWRWGVRLEVLELG